ncbi:aminoglycoside phosphotransferase family protein [Streptomyces sp. LaPpAH-108]|uniref:aminoglycoside phosphotransferase family protein n=1 Tax=Streptomyces sp. LaPpAH-108 TaxID=1155714 RepID=UPI001F305945|nr:aminoglycoside phosphotransferase family protein [Streptomyces sp. LaPpAH-108]
MASSALDALRDACAEIGLDARDAESIRIAENQTWRLRRGGIARIAPPDRFQSATREINVVRWLAERDVPVVWVLRVEQPLERGGLVFTFWEELPPHRHGSTRDVALALKELHALPLPDFDIGRLDPFVCLPEWLRAAQTLTVGDRQWLMSLYDELLERWTAGLPPGLATAPVHGDAWPGNVVQLDHGGWLLMDLARFSAGPPEWDLVSTAVRAKTTGAVTAAEYDAFCDLYGLDVTTWAGYETLAKARELRMATYAAQHAASNPEWKAEAQHRVDCLRGRGGPRPWRWTGIA